MSEERKKSSGAEGFGCLVALFLIVAVPYGVYQWLDDNGWISHTRETVITAEPTWLVGESKTCFSIPVEPQTAGVMKIKPWDVTQKVSCDNGPEHQIKIIFWGKTERSEQRSRFGVSWKCTKESGSFSCYALD